MDTCWIGVETVLDPNGRYCCGLMTHKVTLGEIVDLLQQFKAQPTTLMMPKMPAGSFAKKLYSLYLTYLPKEKIKYGVVSVYQICYAQDSKEGGVW